MLRSLWTILFLTFFASGIQGQTPRQNIPDLPAPEALNRSIEKVKELAEKGDANAQFLVGLYLEHVAPQTAGQPANTAEIRKWYGLAAAQGHPGANYALGKTYGPKTYDLKDRDRVLPSSIERARRHWITAAEKGHIAAMAELSENYKYNYADYVLRQEQLTLRTNPKQVVHWAMRAAEGRHPGAMNDLATWYWKGLFGLPVDFKRTHELLAAAAEQGHCRSMFHLGGLYFNGDGVTQSAAEAEKWFARSKQCDGGDPDIQKRVDSYIQRARSGDLPLLLPEIEKRQQAARKSGPSGSQGVQLSRGEALFITGVLAAIVLVAATGGDSAPSSTPAAPYEYPKLLPPCNSRAEAFFGQQLFGGPCRSW
jgi:TPR repeat protein